MMARKKITRKKCLKTFHSFIFICCHPFPQTMHAAPFRKRKFNAPLFSGIHIYIYYLHSRHISDMIMNHNFDCSIENSSMSMLFHLIWRVCHSLEYRVHTHTHTRAHILFALCVFHSIHWSEKRFCFSPFFSLFFFFFLEFWIYFYYFFSFFSFSPFAFYLKNLYDKWKW